MSSSIFCFRLQQDPYPTHQAGVGASLEDAEASSEASSDSNSDDKKSLQYLNDVVIVHKNSNSEVPDFSPQVNNTVLKNIP